MPDSSNHEIPNWSKLSDEEFENEILKPISLKLGEAEIIFDEKKSWHLIRPKNEVIVVNNVVSHQESIRDDSSTQSFIKERLCYEEEIKLLTDQVNSLSSKLSEYTLQKTSSDHEKDAVVNMLVEERAKNLELKEEIADYKSELANCYDTLIILKNYIVSLHNSK